ncbi:MAG: selenide, water dikinase SelD [Limnobacter sp.]|nr:selenide, water dikinase SelD [Limnobacter sp.]
MQQPDQPILRDIVLIGGGHSHVGVIRMLGMKRLAGVRMTVICTDTDTPYSGMLPGYIAGHYSFDEVHIDLRRLCEMMGARFIRSRVTHIDRSNKKVICEGRPAIGYDVLSINTGSTPQVSLVKGAQENAVPVKPIAQFNERWLALLDRVKHTEKPMNIAVVGGGAGGVELTLAMQFRLRNELKALNKNPDWVQFELFTAGALLPTHNPKARARFEKVLRKRQVNLHFDTQVTQVGTSHVRTAGGQEIAADEIMWVTQAAGPAWLKDTGISVTEHGFVKVRDTLQTYSDDPIFAAGDVADLVERPLEKAGVFAVRMGKPLAKNLLAFLEGKPLTHYRPQRTWLALISTGDKYAVATKGNIAFWGRWVWHWKNWIDQRFMRKFNELQGMAGKMDAPRKQVQIQLEQEENKQAISAIAMRCGGCGAKVGSDVLSRALSQIQPYEQSDVLVGLHAPDDAAVVRVPPGQAVVHTIDFFRAFVDDPYIFGRVAANHALGDVFAMGAKAHTTTAVATVPPGLESKTEELLYHMMTGAVEVLNEAGCSLVGGHTGEGKELALGFAINGLIDENMSHTMTKGALKPGDVLILTKPIGTGTLFAALPQGKARGRWIDAALESMQVSNQRGAEILQAHGCRACTDLTGFGLLGHLVEMTKPSAVDAHLYMDNLPLLNGAQACVENGIVSSLQPANVRLRRAIRDQAKWVKHPRYPLLFDPQTAGGLLASVPAEQAQACLTALHEAGYSHACQIGTIEAEGEELEPIVLSSKPEEN